MSLENRYNMVGVFEAINSNPNGDPDGSGPRIDADGYGYTTDMCLKYMIRNYVAVVKPSVDGLSIYINSTQSKASLNKAAYEAVGAKPGKDVNIEAQQVLCKSHVDIRAFGAVMAVGKAEDDEDCGEKKEKGGKTGRYNCGNLTGPVVVSYAVSVDPIAPTVKNDCITSVSKANADDNQVMCHKSIVGYGVYRFHVVIDPNRKTGLTEEDVQLVIEALWNMFEHDRSAARPEINMRLLVVFKHESRLGNAHDHEVYDLVKVAKKDGIDVPRRWSDYSVAVNTENLPEGVTLANQFPKISRFQS